MYFINEPESKVPIKSAGTYYNYYLKLQKTNKHAQAFLFRTSAFFFWGKKYTKNKSFTQLGMFQKIVLI